MRRKHHETLPLSGPHPVGRPSLDSGFFHPDIHVLHSAPLYYCSLRFPPAGPKKPGPLPAVCFFHEVPAPLSHSFRSSPSAPEDVALALRPWDLEAEQLLGAPLLLFFLFFSDSRPRDRLRLLECLREPT